MSVSSTSSTSYSSTPNTTFDLKNANTSVIELISGQQAIEELKKADDFVNNFSQFDLESRLNLSSPTLEDYLKFIAQQILIWDDESNQAMASCIQFINTTCQERLKLLTYPPRIFVVLTNGKDENNAAYCRNENMIVIPRTIIRHEQLNKTFVHELFHIWSKWNTNLMIRDELYASIGYNKIPTAAPIELPTSLQPIKITNPDAPFVLKYYIELKKLGDENGKTYKCTPILHASRTFDPKFSTNFFAYLVATTLILDDTTYRPLEPLQYLPYAEASNFYHQIGKNTAYPWKNIHQNERKRTRCQKN
ncbi:unnamed protein product [Rotaria socialis]|uniref:Uncharacterized protein n=1 Tax=Rotaria socialis TaxID=392032 RepID=A0A818H666_9BILA|nr:unnamed protein product [Rotaria socialis]CAF4631584.1 unnamed protein product [Rotaria socialis]